jgi:TatA/E family protein of Tat protein translocase
MFGMGMPEIILILAIALIVIGPRKLPDLGRSLGRAMREFRKATSEFKASLDVEDDLGAVRRSFSELNQDLKSSLDTAAYGKSKNSDASGPVGDAGAPAAEPRPAPSASPPSEGAPPAAEERSDAGR